MCFVWVYKKQTLSFLHIIKHVPESPIQLQKPAIYNGTITFSGVCFSYPAQPSVEVTSVAVHYIHSYLEIHWCTS